MPGRTRYAKPGEPTCPAEGCDRPAGFATHHPGVGRCRRCGGARHVVASRAHPPGRNTGGPPLAVVRDELSAARSAGQDFPGAWTDALLAALDGRSRHEVETWDAVMCATWRAWRDAYEGRPSKLTELAPPA